MRKARSVAWFSTAGFHQRSKWTTWLAAVRFSPVPPALSDSRNTRGPPASWNRSTIASRSLRHAAVQEQHLAAERLLEWRLEHVAHLGELGEDQRLFAALERPPPTSRSAGSSLPERPGRRAVAQELGRVVADLLELRQRRQHQPLALDALGLFDFVEPLLDHGGVERRLLLGQACRRPSSPPCPAGRR